MQKVILTQMTEENHLLYDTDPNYAASFWRTDVMISDISSVMPDYFLTGRPVIYCETGATENEIFREMLKGAYRVKDWESLEKTLNDLRNGIDPLKEVRLQKRAELFGEDPMHVAERFLEVLERDAKGEAL